MTVSRIVTIGELPNAQLTDKSVLLHNTGGADGKDKNVTVAQMRDYLVKPEADRAKEAEAKLQANIDAEQKRAKEAEAKESAERKSADNAEAQARQSADNAEAQARQSADTTLQANIDAETARAENAESDLQTALDAETATRKTDVSNAKTVNTALLLAAAQVLERKLKAELERAVNAENELFEAAENESERASRAETELQAQLDTLKADEQTEGSIAQAVNTVKTDILANITDTVTDIANTEIPKLTESALADVKKQVTAAQTQTSALTVFDTRNDNQTPEWYMKTYPRRVVWEFKNSSTIGISSNLYVSLETIVQWSDSSGNYPTQYARQHSSCWVRHGTSLTSWSSWVKVH